MPLSDVVRAVWVQHRTTLLTTSALVIALAAIVGLAARVGDLSTSATGDILQLVGLVPALVGLLLGAPLVPREFERGTRFWAWSQDISPARWMIGTGMVFGGFAVAWAVVAGMAFADLAAQETAGRHTFDTVFFEASPLLLTGTTVFALAVGVMFGVLLRRSVLAGGLTLVTVLLTRFVITLEARPFYLPPLREVTPVGAPAQVTTSSPEVAMIVDSGLLDAQQHATSIPGECYGGNELTACLTGNGVAGTYLDYQPWSRELPFQLIESGLHLGLASVAIAVTLLAVRGVGAAGRR